MSISYKKKYQAAKEREEVLKTHIALLEKENKDLRWENENLWMENKRLTKIKDRVFEAGCVIARELLDLKKTQRG